MQLSSAVRGGATIGVIGLGFVGSIGEAASAVTEATVCLVGGGGRLNGGADFGVTFVLNGLTTLEIIIK